MLKGMRHDESVNSCGMSERTVRPVSQGQTSKWVSPRSRAAAHGMCMALVHGHVHACA